MRRFAAWSVSLGFLLFLPNVVPAVASLGSPWEIRITLTIRLGGPGLSYGSVAYEYRLGKYEVTLGG